MDGDATLRDVAREAGVHPSTASRALNGATRGQVSGATAARVTAAAERLGYRPNALAQGLRSARTGTVGLVLPDLTNPLFPPIVRGLEDRLAAEDVTVLTASSGNDATRERAILDVMLRRRVDGLIVATALRDSPLVDELVARGTPVVLLNRTVDSPPLPSVAPDDHLGMRLAVSHLVGLGHTRIAHVAGSSSASTSIVRQQGFIAWMRESGLEPDPDLIVAARWVTQPDGQVAFGALLDRRPDLTAVVAANDLVALGCYAALAERGRSVPGDVSVVGFNDVPFSEWLSPALTTVRIPKQALGVRAAELMLEAIRDPDAPPVGLRLAPDLVVRGSTAAPRA